MADVVDEQRESLEAGIIRQVEDARREAYQRGVESERARSGGAVLADHVCALLADNLEAAASRLSDYPQHVGAVNEATAILRDASRFGKHERPERAPEGEDIEGDGDTPSGGDAAGRPRGRRRR